MSSTPIQCRHCGHTLAKAHHTGSVRFEVGVRVVLMKDGSVQVMCPCGEPRVVVAGSRKAA